MVSIKLKTDLKSEKKILSKLYLCNKKYEKKKILENASDKQLNIILRILHLIVKGEIPLKSFHFHAIKKSKRLPFILSLKKNINSLLDGNRNAKVKFLSNISTYRELLHMLFNK